MRSDVGRRFDSPTVRRRSQDPWQRGGKPPAKAKIDSLRPRFRTRELASTGSTICWGGPTMMQVLESIRVPDMIPRRDVVAQFHINGTLQVCTESGETGRLWTLRPGNQQTSVTQYFAEKPELTPRLPECCLLPPAQLLTSAGSASVHVGATPGSQYHARGRRSGPR
jgi:hypothetical protein